MTTTDHAEHVPDRHRLPVPWVDAVGALDLEALRGLAPVVRAGLTDALRQAVTLARGARGTVVVPEDTYPLVRSLTDAGEVLRTWASAFEAAAKECDATLEEEALTAVGSYPGVEEAPSGSLFVPDGEGQRIAVTPDWKTGETTWDTATLVGWIIDQEVSHAAVQIASAPPESAAWTENDAAEVARGAVERLLTLGKYTPAASKVEAERKRLAGLQRDSDAAVLRQVRSVGPRQYKGVKITREAAK